MPKESELDSVRVEKWCHSEPESAKMMKGQRVNLSPHYFYNFGIHRKLTQDQPAVSQLMPSMTRHVQRGILHVDVNENAIEFVVKENLNEKMHVNRIATIGPSSSQVESTDTSNGVLANQVTILDTHSNTHNISFHNQDDMELLLQIIREMKSNTFNCLITQVSY